MTLIPAEHAFSGRQKHICRFWFSLACFFIRSLPSGKEAKLVIMSPFLTSFFGRGSEFTVIKLLNVRRDLYVINSKWYLVAKKSLPRFNAQFSNICLKWKFRRGVFLGLNPKKILKSICETEVYLGPSQTSMIKFLCKNGWGLTTVNCFRKKLHMFDRVPNTYLERYPEMNSCSRFTVKTVEYMNIVHS